MGNTDSEIPIADSACGLVGEDATLIQWRSLVQIQPGRPCSMPGRVAQLVRAPC